MDKKINTTCISELLDKSGGLHKFGGVVPEGFIMVHEKTLEDLKKFDTWKSWINNELNLFDLDKKHFNQD